MIMLLKEFFKFHSVSISTFYAINMMRYLANFKFHSVSISTHAGAGRWEKEISLNSILFLYLHCKT